MSHFEELFLFPCPVASPFLLSAPGAFTIFVIKMVVSQCVVSQKTGLQAHMYSTHCTTMKSIYTLYVNFACRSFITPHQVVSVHGWIGPRELVAAAFVCPSWRSFLQSSHLSMTFWSLEQFWWYDLEIFFPKCVHLIHTLLWDRKKSCNTTMNLSLAFQKSWLLWSETSTPPMCEANQTRAGKGLFYQVAIYFSWSFHNTRIIFTRGYSA